MATALSKDGEEEEEEGHSISLLLASLRDEEGESRIESGCYYCSFRSLASCQGVLVALARRLRQGEPCQPHRRASGSGRQENVVEQTVLSRRMLVSLTDEGGGRLSLSASSSGRMDRQVDG